MGWMITSNSGFLRNKPLPGMRVTQTRELINIG
jgi:hypothetical protein